MKTLDAVDLVLASTSRYRRELLARLTENFRSVAPDVDETPLREETPEALAVRLAIAKAEEVAARFPGALVIGSDQVAAMDGRVFGKPGSADHAQAQLAACSGRQVTFYTAVCLAGGSRAWQSQTDLDITRVRLRSLGYEEIARYVDRERPLDCAGSFKAEGLGIALFEQIEGDDPTALIGLPLIRLCRLLRHVGVSAI